MDDDREAYLGLGLSVGGYYYSRRQDPPKDEPKSEGSRSISPDDDYDLTINTNNMMSRKKLRLTKEQSSLLEDTFNLHTTLNPGQKQRLAVQLNLKPRQVEVWFQNRRARTKMKQTEVDCEYLRRWCEELRDENGRLKEELQHLREAYVHCPSCHTVSDRRSI